MRNIIFPKYPKHRLTERRPSGTLSSESETYEFMYERSDTFIRRDRICTWSKQQPPRNVQTRAHSTCSGKHGLRIGTRVPLTIICINRSMALGVPGSIRDKLQLWPTCF
ncbi:hypothetical protein T11_3211 [Trichinella zimbabwensis]|uniref:Uncharacterized protein n=1 Tax=Trichinella zimbabwensis TaxID=268475 RepID=A0A0V1HJW7_9BILA|nr:hypothetical protein T11_3211 [Trichinella zimbabwensis]